MAGFFMRPDSRFAGFAVIATMAGYLGGYLMRDGQTLLCVEFPIPGHPYFAPIGKTIKQQLLPELKERGFGDMVGAGTGQDWIGFTFRVKDSIEARRILASIMAHSMPNQSYRATDIDDKAVCPTAR